MEVALGYGKCILGREIFFIKFFMFLFFKEKSPPLRKKHYSKLISGFTLVELSVSIAIIAIMATLIVANYGAGRRQDELNRSAQEVALNIHRAQNYALFSRVAAECGNKVPLGGYGILMPGTSQTSYQIFADCNGNGTLRPMVGPLNNLESEINFKSLSPSQPLFITFEPPIGSVSVNGVSNGTATIVLQIASDPTQTKTISVAANGSVSVQ